ncbi:hypothetical protein [Roseovarius aquimarinus]|uniref:Uncharacterized protein n=1 Tax=Roseovarius aquimarinus TaxID=1229156 RepID=A0ABW7I5K0_9RHOB
MVLAAGMSIFAKMKQGAALTGRGAMRNVDLRPISPCNAVLPEFFR